MDTTLKRCAEMVSLVNKLKEQSSSMSNVHIDPEIHALRLLHGDLLSTTYSETSIGNRLTIQADTVLAAHNDGNSAVAFHLGSWCEGLTGSSPAEIMSSSLSLDQAQETIAREHGYSDWSFVEAEKATAFDVEFEQAVDAVIHGDIAHLENALRANPTLATQCSQYGHRATLLHYIGANGVESYRQITPMNAAEVSRCLLEFGSDVNAAANIYGSSTPLDLVVTSAHPRNAGVTEQIVAVLQA